MPVARRSVFFDEHGWIETPIWRRDQLPVDYAVEGPAVVEQADATTLLAPGSRARVDAQLNLMCAIG